MSSSEDIIPTSFYLLLIELRFIKFCMNNTLNFINTIPFFDNKMEETLEQKTLTDGTILSLKRYQLPPDSASILNRPPGSYEMILVLREGVDDSSTFPRASWYFSEEVYRQLYTIITNKTGFERVQLFLHPIRNKENAAGIGAFLEEFQRP